jgi:hypothetical protein
MRLKTPEFVVVDEIIKLFGYQHSRTLVACRTDLLASLLS